MHFPIHYFLWIAITCYDTHHWKHIQWIKFMSKSIKWQRHCCKLKIELKIHYWTCGKMNFYHIWIQNIIYLSIERIIKRYSVIYFMHFLIQFKRKKLFACALYKVKYLTKNKPKNQFHLHEYKSENRTFELNHRKSLNYNFRTVI